MDDSPYMPLSEDFLSRLRPGDGFLLGFPRSGTRWLLRVLSDLVLQHSGADPSPWFAGFSPGPDSRPPEGAFCPINPIHIVINAHQSKPEESVMPSLGLPRLFRSHHVDRILAAGHPAVYQFRWPPALLVSYYHYAVELGQLSPGDSPEGFCRWQVNCWKRHAESVLAVADRSTAKLILLRYGDDAPLEASQVARCARHLGIPAGCREIDAALGRLGDHLAILNRNHPLHPRGTNAVAESPFTPEIRDWVLAETGSLFRSLCERAEGSQDPPAPTP